MMQRLNRARPRGCERKGFIQLRQSLDLYHQVKLTHFLRPQSQLAPHQAPGGDFVLRHQMLHEALQVTGEFKIAGARLETEKSVIDVQVAANQFFRLTMRSTA